MKLVLIPLGQGTCLSIRSQLVTDQNWGTVQHSSGAKFPSLKYLGSELRTKHRSKKIHKVGYDFQELAPPAGVSTKPSMLPTEHTGTHQSGSLLCRTRRPPVSPGRFGEAVGVMKNVGALKNQALNNLTLNNLSNNDLWLLAPAKCPAAPPTLSRG